jgi:hypothetical protein
MLVPRWLCSRSVRELIMISSRAAALGVDANPLINQAAAGQSMSLSDFKTRTLLLAEGEQQHRGPSGPAGP